MRKDLLELPGKSKYDAAAFYLCRRVNYSLENILKRSFGIHVSLMNQMCMFLLVCVLI